MKPKPTARLRVILAREAPVAVVIPPGPAKQVFTILQNRQNRRTDEFTLGEAEVFTVAVRTVDPEGGA
jgi:hypothetical protein